MTQKEFEQRAGMKVGEAYYKEVVEKYYMSIPMEKDEFCDQWAKDHEGITRPAMALICDEVDELVQEMREWKTKACEVEKEAYEMEQKNKELRGQLEEERKALVEEQERTAQDYEKLYAICADMEDRYELREMCVRRFGWKDYLRKKLAGGFELLDDEREKVIEFLD